MEEPLLGSKKRLTSHLNPTLFQFPEEAPADNSAPGIPILNASPSSIKERLIFGSLDTSPRSQFFWLDYAFSLEQLNNEDQLSEDIESVCTCGNNARGSNESAIEPQVKAFDDSFIDSRMIGSGASRQRSLADLTRIDLDVKAASPRGRPSSLRSPSSRSLLERLESGKERAKPFITIPMPPEAEAPCSETPTECRMCTKKQFHRSRTAPAMTVMEEMKKPHALHARVSSQSSAMPIPVVTQAFIGLLLYLAVGVSIYIWRDDDFTGTSTHGFIDAIYFCIVTLCTIGYGDIAPVTPFSKIFACAFVLVGFGFIDILLSGMVNYVLDSQEALLLNAVAAGHHETAKNYLVDIKKGRMRIRMKVALAFGVVIMCIGVGTLVIHFVEALGWLDSLYLACMSVTTVGYGDHAFRTMAGRLFASLWLLVSTLAVARSFLYLAEARIDKRHRLIAKLVLEKEMTVGDLVAADIDQDGCVSKSDFVVYKLKQMGKITEKDVADVCRQFDRLDTENLGKITLSCLLNLHEAAKAPK